MNPRPVHQCLTPLGIPCDKLAPRHDKVGSSTPLYRSDRNRRPHMHHRTGIASKQSAALQALDSIDLADSSRQHIPPPYCRLILLRPYHHGDPIAHHDALSTDSHIHCCCAHTTDTPSNRATRTACGIFNFSVRYVKNRLAAMIGHLKHMVDHRPADMIPSTCEAIHTRPRMDRHPRRQRHRYFWPLRFALAIKR